MGPTTAPVIQALLADSGSSADVGDAACALVLAGVFPEISRGSRLSYRELCLLLRPSSS